jgi:hypothetical protein
MVRPEQFESHQKEGNAGQQGECKPCYSQSQADICDDTLDMGRHAVACVRAAASLPMNSPARKIAI